VATNSTSFVSSRTQIAVQLNVCSGSRLRAIACPLHSFNFLSLHPSSYPLPLPLPRRTHVTNARPPHRSLVCGVLCCDVTASYKINVLTSGVHARFLGPHSRPSVRPSDRPSVRRWPPLFTTHRSARSARTAQLVSPATDSDQFGNRGMRVCYR
jgi:hypothetical protein